MHFSLRIDKEFSQYPPSLQQKMLLHPLRVPNTANGMR